MPGSTPKNFRRRSQSSSQDTPQMPETTNAEEEFTDADEITSAEALALIAEQVKAARETGDEAEPLTAEQEATVKALLSEIAAHASEMPKNEAPAPAGEVVAPPPQSHFDYGKALVKTGLFAVSSCVIRGVLALPSLSLSSIGQAALEGGVGGAVIGGAIIGALALLKQDPKVNLGMVIQMLFWASSTGSYLIGETPTPDLLAMNSTMAEHGWTCEPPAF